MVSPDSLQSQYCLFVQLGQTTHRSPGAFHTKFWKTPRKTSGAAANVFPANPRTQVAYSHMIISTVKEGIGFLLLLCSRLEHPKQPRRSVGRLKYGRTRIYRTPKGSRNSSIYEKFDIKNMRSETSAVAHGHLLIGAFKNDN